MEYNRNILIDLDSILDVRLAILYSLYPNYIDTITANYLKRKTDTFGNLPFTVFKAYYDKRNKHILNYGIPTNIFVILEEVLANHNEHIAFAGDEVTLYINSYPYNLNNDEIKEFKVRIENEYKNVNIAFINYSMEDLTPEFIINNKIYTIIMYHGLEWLNKQVGLLNIVKNPLLNRELIVPALVDNLAIDKANKKLFEELSKRMGTILTLQFVDARYFSPERLEK